MAVYTTIDDPSAHFQAFLYTGTGSNRTITLPGNSDLKFDFYWYKQRSQTGHHRMFDTTRGNIELYPDLVSGESAATYFNNQQANSFDIIAHDSATNTGDVTFANWQWKANGGTTANNTTGSLASVVQANTTAGFSIVTWTGAGGNRTVGHGLGVAPAVIIVKNRSTSTQWGVWHKDLADTDKNLRINSTSAEVDDALWNDTVPTSSVFSISSAAEVGNNSIGYCFAEKQGYSNFGKYIGNGNADGTFVYTGFKPAFVLWKIISTTGDWRLVDTKRGVNGAIPRIKANSNSAEGSAGDNVDLLSNGFKFRSTAASANAAGASYVYMAFAENPFVTSTGTPTTAG